MINDITELNKLIENAKIELEEMGVVKNYETADKFEYLTGLISKYQQQIVIIKKQTNNLLIKEKWQVNK